MFSTAITSAADSERAHAYEAWRLAADEAAHALRAWTASSEDERLAAFVSYAAALDREERAALALADHTTEPHR
jgi:hypothetical protein